MSCHSEYELVLRVAVHIYSIRDYINPNYSEVSLSSEKEHPDLALISIDIYIHIHINIYTYTLNRIYYDAAEQSYGKTCEEERQARPVSSGQSQSLRALTVQ